MTLAAIESDEFFDVTGLWLILDKLGADPVLLRYWASLDFSQRAELQCFMS